MVNFPDYWGVKSYNSAKDELYKYKKKKEIKTAKELNRHDIVLMITDEGRKELLVRKKGKCFECGKEGDQWYILSDFYLDSGSVPWCAECTIDDVKEGLYKIYSVEKK